MVLAKRKQKATRFEAPRYRPESNDYVIWELNASQVRSVLNVTGEQKAFVVAEEYGVPFAMFWSWWDAVAYVAGKQIIERIGKVVWYASPEAVERAEEEDGDPSSMFMYAQWMPYFHQQYVPPWFHRFLPGIPTPFDTRENPTHRAGMSSRKRVAACSCTPTRRNPSRASKAKSPPVPQFMEPDDDYDESEYGEEYGSDPSCDPHNEFKDVPMGSYVLVELEPCYCGGETCNNVGVRIGVYYDDTSIAQFGLGYSEFDRDAIWEEAFLFVAAHQLFTRNIRPVWVRPLQWPEVQPMPPVGSPGYYEWLEQADEWSQPIGKYPPFMFDGFHVQYYPYAIGAALELPAPPPPPGQLPPPEPTIVAVRATRRAQQHAELQSQMTSGALGGARLVGGLLPGRR